MVIKGYCFISDNQPLSIDLVSGQQVLFAETIGTVTLTETKEGAIELIKDYRLRNKIQIKEVLLVIKS